MSEEQVVLMADDGTVLGSADKAAVHGKRTPLHLAFSCYVINSREEVLLTRRAESKPTWPGVWTNSCCGHPMPGEGMLDAVRRRLAHELGLTSARIDPILLDFRYQAVMANGIMENEICPVFRAVADGETVTISLNPAEVDAARWMPWRAFAHDVVTETLAISPWCRDQVDRLHALGSPLEWPSAPVTDLPGAV